MKHIAVAVQSIEELEKFLEENKMHAASAQSVLAQVFVAAQDPVWIRRVCDTIKGFSERVVIAGTTTAGEICAGRALNNTTVVSLSFFEASTLLSIAFPAKAGQEVESGKKLVEEIRKISTPIKGLLLFVPSLFLNCSVEERAGEVGA